MYRKAFDHTSFSDFSLEDATSLRVTGSDGAKTYITYGGCEYRGLWWAPDSSKYVIALQYDGGPYLALSWLEAHRESNLNAYLSMGVEMTEPRKYGERDRVPRDRIPGPAVGAGQRLHADLLFLPGQ